LKDKKRIVLHDRKLTNNRNPIDEVGLQNGGTRRHRDAGIETAD
jgi:hypothetical protein